MSLSFDEAIFERINQVMVPFFRGYYNRAFERAEQLAQTPLRGKTAGLERELHRAVAESTPRGDQEVAVETALELARSSRGIPGLGRNQRTFFQFYGYTFAGWALSSRRGRQQLDRAGQYLSIAVRLYEDALKPLGRGHYVIPGGWMAFQFRGWCHYHLGDIARAIQDYNRGVMALNDYVAAQQARRLVRSDWGGAREFIQQRVPSVARLLSIRAMLFYELGDFHRAQEDIALAIEIDPLNAHVRGWAGVIDWGMNRHEEALQHLVDARSLYAESGEPSSGRPEYFLYLFSCQSRFDPDTQDSLSTGARSLLRELPARREFADNVLGKLLETNRVREALCCILVGLDPDPGGHALSGQPAFAWQMIVQLMAALDGLNDYLGAIATHEARALSLLKRTLD